MKKSNTSIIVAVIAGAGLLWWLKKRKAANTNNAPANDEENNGGNNGGLKPHITPVIVPGKDTTDLGGKTQYIVDKPGKEGGTVILTPAVITKG